MEAGSADHRFCGLRLFQPQNSLSNPVIAARLEEQGHEHVREHFLITSSAKRYLTLFLNHLATA